MNLIPVILFILGSFFLHLTVNAADLDLLQVDRELRSLHSSFKRDFIAPSIKKNLKQKMVLNHAEREAYYEHMAKYVSLFKDLQEKAGPRRLNAGSTRRKTQERVVAKVLLLSHASKLFSEVLSFPALIGLIKANEDIPGIPKDFLHELVMQIAKESKNSIRRGSVRSFTDLKRPTLADFLSYPKEFSFWVKHFDLPLEYKFLVHEMMENYVSSVRKFSKLQSEVMTYRLSIRWLYNVKVSTMTWLGDIALKDKNVFDKEWLEKMESRLMPGDIGVINQDGRLSNLVFTGTWSHGLFYLGPYSQLESIFSEDKKTNQIYMAKCQKYGMLCYDYLSYMLEKFPDSFGKYKDSVGTDKEITVIEANSEGVVLSTSKYALAFNRIATFRPKLSLKDKAMAIEEAFNNYGKPYDFNFDNRTYGRIVCTELILYSYLPDPRIEKEGLEWFMSVVSGTPAMYGYDIVETFFETPEHSRMLDFLFYFESPRSGGGAKEMGLADLRKTVSPDMSKLKE